MLMPLARHQRLGWTPRSNQVARPLQGQGHVCAAVQLSPTARPEGGRGRPFSLGRKVVGGSPAVNLPVALARLSDLVG